MVAGQETLTPEEAAQYLRVNPQTVYRLLRNGKLPGAKIGHQWRIRRADLEALLHGHEAPLPSDSAPTGSQERQ